MSDEKAAVVRFLMTYCTSDHLGDISNGIDPLMKAFGIDPGDDWYEGSELLDGLVSLGLVNEVNWEVIR